MKKITICIVFILSFCQGQSQRTEFVKTNQKFENGEFVWNIFDGSDIVGEFWPIHAINLVTKQSDPSVFSGNTAEVQKNLQGVATTPDGMTGGSIGAYQMQGKSLSHGIPCGDGFVYDYGIVAVSSNGYSIWFTHKREQDFDSLYQAYQTSKSTLFFLPSIMRNGNYLSSNKMVDKVLIRRTTPNGEQIGVVLLQQLMTYDNVRQLIVGLDRPGRSQTTHIYVLDGGGTWGQSAKEVNGSIVTVGTHDPTAITNYLVFY
jgi:hypothetical protein